MPHEWQAEVHLEVPFHDVDVMGVAWHGHYVKYFEAARGALLRALDYDYPQMRDSGYLWPVVECQLKYVRPARYGQKLRVTARLLEYENRLKIAYEIFDATSGERLTRGYTLQVAVEAASEELQFVSPRALLERVERPEA
ncbi:MAG: thioesterase family protein [Pseudomonadota bacterium]|nr:thioesterase family protein [Pseudomonadota bacterium]MDP1903234.1 thioesterase family protein [Pseudomonadota bacterium]MDP2352743.1 thioesterase family protein [Pseudomonadota bacterium]